MSTYYGGGGGGGGGCSSALEPTDVLTIIFISN